LEEKGRLEVEEKGRLEVEEKGRLEVEEKGKTPSIFHACWDIKLLSQFGIHAMISAFSGRFL
jgi:hypothetical protein